MIALEMLHYYMYWVHVQCIFKINQIWGSYVIETVCGITQTSKNVFCKIQNILVIIYMHGVHPMSRMKTKNFVQKNETKTADSSFLPKHVTRGGGRRKLR